MSKNANKSKVFIKCSQMVKRKIQTWGLKNEVNGLVPFMICSSTTLRLFAGAEAVWCVKPTVE